MKCLRIYADETGESHLTDIDIPLVPVELFPGFRRSTSPLSMRPVPCVLRGSLQEYGKPAGTSLRCGNSLFG